MNSITRKEIEKKIDILEDDIAELDPELLKLLLKDKSTHKNILWCTKDYEKYGREFNEHAQMQVELITGRYHKVIQPRAAKAKYIQEMRIKRRAEVFTPSWVCNEQNNQVDEAWFGRKNVFNTPNGTSWITNTEKIVFDSRKWEDYVKATRLEITCGEAPYLISRYDTTTGKQISIYERIGLFDRKMRIVNENCKSDDKWTIWSLNALKSVYGYEFQGDSVLIARENLLYDYMDYYKERFKQEPPIELLKKVANIIAWNIWQMDGLKCVVPFSCHDMKPPVSQISLFDILETKTEEKMVSCPGCEKNNIFSHNGIYCHIYDWNNLNKSIPFIDVFKEETIDGKI